MIASQASGWRQIDEILALGITVGYLAVPFTALHRLKFTRPTRIFAVLFFLSCGLNHLALAAGYTDARFAVANDVVNLVALVGFFRGLVRQVEFALRRCAERRSAGEAAEGGDEAAGAPR